MRGLRKFSVCVLVVVVGFVSSSFNARAEGTTECIRVIDLRHGHHGESGQLTPGGCCTEPVYHVHEGNEVDGGGCYVASYKTVTTNVLCGKSGSLVSNNSWCCVDGHYETNSYGFDVFPHGDTCGKVLETVTEEVFDGYVLNCGYEEGDVEGYTYGCGYTSGQLIGHFLVYKTVENGYVLSLDSDGDIEIDKCIWGDGTVSNSYTVTSNGTYSVEIHFTEVGGESSYFTLPHTVSDYDIEPPIINSVDLSTEGRCQYALLGVNAEDENQINGYKLER